jgi:hypothetical protein
MTLTFRPEVAYSQSVPRRRVGKPEEAEVDEVRG